jgi:hypothetical protein
MLARKLKEEDELRRYIIIERGVSTEGHSYLQGLKLNLPIYLLFAGLEATKT